MLSRLFLRNFPNADPAKETQKRPQMAEGANRPVPFNIAAPWVPKHTDNTANLATGCGPLSEHRSANISPIIPRVKTPTQPGTDIGRTSCTVPAMHVQLAAKSNLDSKSWSGLFTKLTPSLNPGAYRPSAAGLLMKPVDERFRQDDTRKTHFSHRATFATQWNPFMNSGFSSGAPGPEASNSTISGA